MRTDDQIARDATREALEEFINEMHKWAFQEVERQLKEQNELGRRLMLMTAESALDVAKREQQGMGLK